jgi:hypothetical protein
VHATFFDYDLDGDLDLFLLNNYENARLSAGYRERIIDGSAPSNDNLYRNNGDGTFTDVTLQSGIVYEGFSLGLALGDVNKDGYPDIYVSNDYVSNDILYINQGDGTFRNEIDSYLSYQTFSSMGNDMADINNDGYPDIYTLDMMPEDYARKKQTINGFGYIYYINDAKYGYEHQYLRNMLHLHNGFVGDQMVPYSEVGQLMGIYQTEWSWAPLFADFDNDGDKDLAVTNGYPRDMTDKDGIKSMTGNMRDFSSPLEAIGILPEVKVPNYAFANEGNLRFTDKTQDWFGETPSFSYGAAFSDLDNDGDLDYIVNNLNDKAFIFRNHTVEQGEGKQNYLQVELVGSKGNSLAYGAKVEIWCNGLYQYQEQYPSRGYASSVETILHFGLAGQNRVDSLKVTWPKGDRKSLRYSINVNQRVRINETEAVPVDLKSEASRETDYLFKPEEDLLQYTHLQNDFMDYHYSQAIIPHKFSQIGPVIQKGDLNGDGLEDVLIGATNALPTMAFIQRNGKFLKTHLAGLTQQKDCPESDLAIIDVDLDGDQDVVALAGGYENREEEYKHYLYLNRGNSFTKIPLPLTSFPASVVRPFDFDHDGDLDLFIGARISMEIFPFSANSWLLLNENGEFREERSLSFFLGMVTDAVWSDYDGDGWEDLLVSREWNSVAMIRNLSGNQIQIQEIPELESKHGIWYSISAGDFDGDGDDDYLLGNLGNNHRFTVSEAYPLRLYALDMDLNGTLDPISTAFWKDASGVMQEYPIHYLDELTMQSTYFSRLFETYNSFSYATIDDILDPQSRAKIDYSLHVNTTSSYMLWNREGSLHWEKLPEQAQVSPLKRVVVEDFNKDGFPDALLAGNDHTYDVSTGYYDASKGLVLLSTPDYPLGKVLSPSRSGIMLHGMVESLCIIQGNSPLVIAGINRGDIEVFSLH